MIQRIQTVYLVIVLLLGILSFFFPLAHFNAISGEGQAADYVIKVCTTEISGAESTYKHVRLNMGLAIADSLLVVLVLAGMFLYKNRLRQLKGIRLATLVLLVVIFLVFWYTDSAQQEAGVEQVSAYSWYNILFLVQLILLWLAGRAVMADEKLVRSADRLR